MYLNLKTELERNNLSIDNIADLLEIHRNSASNKINGDSDFTVEQAFAVREKMFPYADLQYLFKKVQKVN